MGKKVAVIGGGYSGLAAAFTLAESGIPVTLFESSRTLGGRAKGMDWKGLRLDNGQHILLGCYRETLALIEKACRHPEPFLRIPLELSVDDFHIKTLPLPEPLNLLFGMLSAKGISFSEKLSALGFLSKMKSMKGLDINVSELLEKYGQSCRLCELLWKPLCISALNTPIEIASSNVFISVLKDALNGSDMLIPRINLSSLFPSGAARFITKNGGEILLSKPIRSVVKHHAGFDLLTDGETFSFSHVICAVAPYHLSRLTEALPEIRVQDFDYQPICTVYSQYPERVRLPGKMMGSSRGLAQWLFDRGAICGQKGLIAAVISAARLELSFDSIASTMHEETKKLVPDLPPPLWQKVILEKRATFSCTANLQRPGNETPLKDFYLAGDYTASPYPATLESAVRSGLSCARLALKTI